MSEIRGTIKAKAQQLAVGTDENLAQDMGMGAQFGGYISLGGGASLECDVYGFEDATGLFMERDSSCVSNPGYCSILEVGPSAEVYATASNSIYAHAIELDKLILNGHLRAQVLDNGNYDSKAMTEAYGLSIAGEATVDGGVFKIYTPASVQTSIGVADVFVEEVRPTSPFYLESLGADDSILQAGQPTSYVPGFSNTVGAGIMSCYQGFVDEESIPITEPSETGTVAELAKLCTDNRLNTVVFTGTAIELTSANVSLGYTSGTYKPGKLKPSVTVYDPDGDPLTAGVDYTVTSPTIKGAGDYEVVIEGIGGFKGTVTKTYTITPKALTSSMVTLSKTAYSFDGKVKKPTPTVKWTYAKGKTATLKAGTDYTVAYKNNKTGARVTSPKNIGTFTVIITGKGNYSDTVTKTYTVKPATTSVGKLTRGTASRSMKVIWTPKKSSVKATGVQIRYSTSKSFKTYKTVTVKSYKTSTKTIKNLKANKKYYVKMRTYKTVGKTKIYSAWSDKKYVTVR